MMTSKPLVKALRDLGYPREALILDILGGACEAWSAPCQSEATRSRKLHLLSILVFRLFGDGLLNVKCLRTEKFRGIPTQQWLNLLANADARRHALCSLDIRDRRQLCEKSLGTPLCESLYSTISNNSTSGKKTDPAAIQACIPQLDVANDIKIEAQEERGAFGARQSSRQRKLGEGKTKKDWNEDIGDSAPYNSSLDQKARQHTGGSKNHSVRDMVKARTGM